MQLSSGLKLYKVKGFYVTQFYVLASSPEKAKEQAENALVFRVEEVSLEELGLTK